MDFENAIWLGSVTYKSDNHPYKMIGRPYYGLASIFAVPGFARPHPGLYADTRYAGQLSRNTNIALLMPVNARENVIR